jgi:hypothetical protein
MPGFHVNFRLEDSDIKYFWYRNALVFRDRNNNTSNVEWKLFVEAALAGSIFIIFIDYRSPHNNINQAILWNSLIEIIYS